ncbi:type II toxin-antitoxin system RelE/ParE family toxin [Aerococcus urinaeequi]|uniref:type II toxin-antitoxin system RelE family toxin n=1 Tax=Aerococcus urinaeequi TaxID=51665 RepID=UPI002282D1F5|nr:type II toxin-antitoxin system RelE/ParE family toxin [Aerococcus urinaeequi]MCY7731789.1 type II toxin-antitoxin system RelE/ParE family toxin [Aerococcus urinaeequi]
MYQVRYSKKAIKALSKMDKFDSSSIVKWMVKNIDGKDNPRTQGKALVGDKKGLWRYRVGDYRVLCQIQDDELVVLVVDTGHRRSIYDD